MLKLIKDRKETILYFSNTEIFRVQKEDLRRTCYLFGKKIYRIRKIANLKIYRRLIALESRLIALETFINNAIGISNLLPAKGMRRDIQKAQVNMLKEIDRICQQHQLTYWIDFGTLLGAVRHQGFIPWDDDADVSMLRSDYQKFLTLFNKNTQDKNLYATLYSGDEGRVNVMRIRHKEISSISIDVFPCDFCYQQMNTTQKLAFSQKLKSLTLKNAHNASKLSTADFHKSFLKLRDENIPDLQKNHVEKPTVFHGCEFLHASHRYTAFDYDVIFPLQKIKFEDAEFPAVNQPDIYLTCLYGDYMQIPKEISEHVDISAFSLEEMIALKTYSREEA